ncbi:hypothetical protein [Halomonas sp. A11-A]|uniref:hypothetical protein n=1 Tax=Halomonas sp. A11-A TaxID=2183985 RepID=UPI000D80DFAC|nr:hypothetical protein [Halomonas sp. A11-A]PWV79850.1 hypothetical protein DER72_104125 [Halomonas sp. A11-A]
MIVPIAFAIRPLTGVTGYYGYYGYWRFSELRSCHFATSDRSTIGGTRPTRCMTATRS